MQCQQCTAVIFYLLCLKVCVSIKDSELCKLLIQKRMLSNAFSESPPASSYDEWPAWRSTLRGHTWTEDTSSRIDTGIGARSQQLRSHNVKTAASCWCFYFSSARTPVRLSIWWTVIEQWAVLITFAGITIRTFLAMPQVLLLFWLRQSLFSHAGCCCAVRTQFKE